MIKILIGIDPGVNTGVAYSAGGKLALTSGCITKMQYLVNALKMQHGVSNIIVYIEDARKRNWIPTEKNQKQVVGRAKGAGSVWRDCAIWQEFCEYHDIEYELVAPKNNKTKLNSADFRRLTGWQISSNQHERDAAMLIFGR